MAPQTPGGSTVTLSSATGKKKASLGKISRNPPTMETRRMAALNLLLGKDVDELISTTDQPTGVKSVSPKKKLSNQYYGKKTMTRIWKILQRKRVMSAYF